MERQTIDHRRKATNIPELNYYSLKWVPNDIIIPIDEGVSQPSSEMILFKILFAIGDNFYI